MTSTDEQRLELRGAEATEALGEDLAQQVRGDWFHVELHGSLGSGKTTLVRGMLRAFGVEGHIRSPTFTLVETYEARGYTILHCDFFRLKDQSEVADLDLAAHGDKLVTLVEWPEVGKPVLPPPSVRVHLTVDPQHLETLRYAEIETALDVISERSDQSATSSR